MRTLFETQGQGYIFLLMIYLGLGMGALDQGLAALWAQGRKFLGILGGVVACGLETAAGVWLLVQTGQESLRMYGVMGVGLGWLLYALGVGRLVAKLARCIGSLCHKIKPVKSADEAGKKTPAENTHR